MTGTDESGSARRLVKITLDEGSIGRSSSDIEHERAVAIYDLIEDNSFAPTDHDDGPYALHLSITENRLVFDIRLEDGAPVVAHLLSLTPFRRIVKDYFLICDSYYKAIRTATPTQIEALDMGRRGRASRLVVVSGGGAPELRGCALAMVFCCGRTYVGSAGVRKGELDPFAV